MANRIPKKDSEFDQYIQISMNYLASGTGAPPVSNYVRLGLSNSEYSQWVNYCQGTNQWLEPYPQYTNPETRTHSVTEHKNNIKKAFTAFASPLLTRMSVHPALTENDRSALNLPEHDHTPTHAPVPANSPRVSIDKIKHLQHTLRITDPDNPHTQSKPEGVAQTEVQVFLGTAAPTPAAAWAHIASTGKFLYTVNYTDADVTKTAWYRCRWLNTRGEPGPWSSTVSAVVA